MAEEMSLPSDECIEYHLVTIFEKLEALRDAQEHGTASGAVPVHATPVQVEVRTLEFWRAVISECLATFVYVFVVCGATAGAGGTVPSVLLATALASGFAMTSLTQCFGHISGAHINPAVSIAMGITKKITLLRAAMFVVAQCGGGIGGAAFLHGVMVPGYQGNLATTFTHSVSEAPWEKFGIEFILSFVTVFAYFVSMGSHRKWMGATPALTIGATYSACSFVSMPFLNPARSLGPSFVLNRWDNHWVYWIAPIVGGAIAGLTFEYVFNGASSSLGGRHQRHAMIKATADGGDTSSINSDADTYDDMDNKPVNSQPKFHGSTYNTYRSATGPMPGGNTNGGGGGGNYSSSLYSAPATKLEREESLYGGTKSLYCKSPPLTRANLNRSQSVYAKSNSNMNRAGTSGGGGCSDTLPKPGPLMPTRSLYPLNISQHQSSNTQHVQNQNLQNQMQQGAYGVRGVTPGTATRMDAGGFVTAERGQNYGRTANTGNSAEEGGKSGRRPESMYGMLGSRHRTANPNSNAVFNSNNFSSAAAAVVAAGIGGGVGGGNGGGVSRQMGGGGDCAMQQQPPQQLHSVGGVGGGIGGPASGSKSYHMPMSQHSPKLQY